MEPAYQVKVTTTRPSPATAVEHSDDGMPSGELQPLDCDLASLSCHIQMEEGFNSGNFHRSSYFRNVHIKEPMDDGLPQKTKQLGSLAASWNNGSNAMLLLLLLLLITRTAYGQQAYVANHQLDCYNQTFNATTLGYLCNGITTSCKSYLTVRSSPLYSSPVYIAYLLNATATAAEIASLNNLTSDVASIPANTLVLVPVNCSCSGRRYYQHDTTYALKSHSETYFSVANNTYQGLTTCQSLMSQNPYNDRHLAVNEILRVPLRCACPTASQTRTTAANTGPRYLLTYIVTWGDSISYIAELFGVDQQSVLDANQLTAQSVIYPFTPILVPLSAEPNSSFLLRSSPAAPPPGPPQTPTDTTVVLPSHGGSNSKKWVFVGVGTALALLLLIAILAAVKFARRKKQSPPLHSSTTMKEEETKGNLASTPTPQWETESGSAWSLSQGIKNSVEALTLYKFRDLELATGHFSDSNRIKGSVYKGSFNEDAAAVKVMKGDLSASPEINILKTISHSNIIRLSGFCVNDGTTYLVYEYAENGALTDWLFLGPGKMKQQQLLLQQETLTWKQRVQIAHDVAEALNYLHSYADPPYIHKNLKSSNILLDADLRAKVTNFGLARTGALEEGEQNNNGDDDDTGGAQLTRHVVGTYGYMAPEYIENGLITPKLDVFAFGVVMLELLSGKEAASRDDELLFTMINKVLEGDNVREKLRGFIDPSLAIDEYPLDLAFSMAQLAKGCVSIDLNGRPSMPQVFMTLSKILSSSLDWDPSHELLQPSSVSGSIRSGR